MDVCEVIKDAVIASASTAITDENRSKGAAVKKFVAASEAAKDNELFCKLGHLFYERFKKEDVIDERRKADFIENGIPNVGPPWG